MSLRDELGSHLNLLSEAVQCNDSDLIEVIKYSREDHRELQKQANEALGFLNEKRKLEEPELRKQELMEEDQG